jgi:hypothetical protein
MRHLWRLTLWGGTAASALLVAVLASRSDAGSQRIAGLFFIRGDRTQVAAQPFDAETEAHRLAEAVRGLNAENQELKSRLAAVEHNVDDITGSVARQIEVIKETKPAPPPAPIPAPGHAAPPAAAPMAKATIAEPAGAAPAPAPVQLGAAAPQHAAAPAPAPAAPAPQHIAAAPPHVAAPAPNAAAPDPHAEPPAALAPQYGVDIGSAVSIQVLRAHWLGVRSAHAQLFDGLMPVVMLREVPHTGRVELRLVVGPLANAEAAAKLCTALAPYRLSCQPTLFSGQHVALQ